MVPHVNRVNQINFWELGMEGLQLRPYGLSKWTPHREKTTMAYEMNAHLLLLCTCDAAKKP
jgi:hypothetical protein